MPNELKTIRKALKITAKDIELDSRTVNKIESGDESVSVKVLKQYLSAIGLRLTYSIE